MNKKNKIAIIILSIISILLISIGAVFGYKYYQQSQKEKLVRNFITQFEQKDFKEMVKLLDQNSLKVAKLNEKTAIEKYDTIFNGLNITKIKGNLKEVTDSRFTVQFNMTTPIGELKNLSYTGELIHENGDYLIDWDYSLIFPSMKLGDKVYMSHELPIRGDILDTEGQPLATFHDYPQYGVVPKKLGKGEEKEEKIKNITDQLGMTREEINTLLGQDWVKSDSFVPLKTIDFNSDGRRITEESLEERTILKRYYPLKEAAAQLVGYTGSVTAEEVKKDPDLSGFDDSGKTGLELQLDKELRGKIGGKINIVDDNNQVKSTLIEKKVKNGQDVQLTIDSHTQREAYNALNNLTGATVVTEPKTGNLKAVVSSPSYNPNEFIIGMTQKRYDELEKNTSTPLLARFGMGYAPGSTFKTITAAIGIDAGVTTPEKTHDISGLKWQKDGSWGGYYVTRVSDVPKVNMEDALVYSDNIYFSMEALEIGEKNYIKGLEKFPFGEKMNVSIPMTPAQISNDEIKSDILLADTSYGQGQLLINPIQQAAMYSVFPNGGTIVMPKIIKSNKTNEINDVISASAASAVTKALIQTVDNPNGTAHILQSGKEIAAKTGTAEIKDKQDTKGKENSFILAFDSKAERYLIVSMIEGAQGTSAVEQNKEFINQLP